MAQTQRVSEATTLTLQWRAMFNLGRSQVNITIPVLIIFNIAHDFTSRHSILAFTIPILLAFLQIQTVGAEPSPFQAHPGTTRASVIGVLGYYLSFGAKLWLPSYASQLSFVMSLLGSFTVASLASLLLPHSLWRFRFVFYGLLMLAEWHWHPSVRRIYEQYCVRHRWGRQLLRMRAAAPPHLLPQTYVDLTRQ